LEGATRLERSGQISGRPSTAAKFKLERATHLFFSSRRRHTRSYGDWSSDVCSSDLAGVPSAERRKATSGLEGSPPRGGRAGQRRSEERRVGKECRCRGSGDDWNKRVPSSRTGRRRGGHARTRRQLAPSPRSTLARLS